MSPSSSVPGAPGFTDDDLALLERTADALSAWWGKPVMAEQGATDGVPWVVFGIPLAQDADEGEHVVWQMGGDTRRLGNAGGLAPAPADVHDCRLLWVIQVTPTPGERYVKLDDHGQVVDWSDELAELLPFDVDFEDPDEDDDEEDEDDVAPPAR